MQVRVCPELTPGRTLTKKFSSRSYCTAVRKLTRRYNGIPDRRFLCQSYFTPLPKLARRYIDMTETEVRRGVG